MSNLTTPRPGCRERAGRGPMCRTGALVQTGFAHLPDLCERVPSAKNRHMKSEPGGRFSSCKRTCFPWARQFSAIFLIAHGTPGRLSITGRKGTSASAAKHTVLVDDRS